MDPLSKKKNSIQIFKRLCINKIIRQNVQKIASILKNGFGTHHDEVLLLELGLLTLASDVDTLPTRAAT